MSRTFIWFSPTVPKHFPVYKRGCYENNWFLEENIVKDLDMLTNDTLIFI